MKQRFVTQAAMKAMMGLVFAVTFPLLSCSAFAGSDELLTYKSSEGTFSGLCETSNYEKCPSLDCTCLSSRGSASSDLTGAGFAAFDMMIADEVVNGCQEFNASIFIIAPKDLEELDFSGTACDELRIFSGNYVLAISQAGYSGSGTVSGRINGASGNRNSVVFRFHRAVPGR
jgi:hypothetical protein